MVLYTTALLELDGVDHELPPPHTHRGLRSGLWLPSRTWPTPVVVTQLAVEAEAAGWHGVFVWDHLRWAAPVWSVADP